MSYWSNLKVTGQPGRRQAPVQGASTNHRGVDVIFPDGKVRPEIGGTVVYSGNMDGYGNIIIVKGDDGNFYHYAHNANNKVKKGQRVEPGQVIGTMGATGVASGPHTHIEVTDARGNNLHPQTKQNLGIGGNKLASQGFYGNDPNIMGAAAPLDAQRVYAPVPQIIDPTYDVGNIGTQTLESLLAQAEQHRRLQEQLAKDPRYDITRQMQQADANIQAIQDQALPDINAQSYQNVLSPSEMLERAEQAKRENDIARLQAQNAINTIYADYKARPEAQANADFLNKQAQLINQSFVNANPIAQQLYSGQGGGYQIDPQEVQRRMQLDKSYDAAMMASAARAAREGHPEIGNIYANQIGLNSSTQDYLRNAEAAYQAKLANQYGMPYQQVMDQAKAMQDFQKAYVPNLMAGQKEAMMQPEMNFREVAPKAIDTAQKMYNTGVEANKDYLTSLQNADKNYIEANKAGANLIGNLAEQRGELQAKQPQRILDKYEIESKAYGLPVPYSMQGTTSVGNTVMNDTTKAAESLNKAATDIYNAQVKENLTNEQNMIKAYEAQYGKPSAKQQKTEEELRANDAVQVAKLVNSPVTNRPDPSNYGLVKNYLMSTGRYTNQEIADILVRMFQERPQVTEQKGRRR